METELTYLGMGPVEWFALGFGAGMTFAFAAARRTFAFIEGVRQRRRGQDEPQE